MSKKIHALVTLISANGKFDLDTHDLAEMNGFDVLDHFGIDEWLHEWEEAEFMLEMQRLAERYQTSAIVESLDFGLGFA